MGVLFLAVSHLQLNIEILLLRTLKYPTMLHLKGRLLHLTKYLVVINVVTGVNMLKVLPS